MWGEQQQQRFEWLRDRERSGMLTQTEHAELEQMIQEVEAAEAAYLSAAVERTRSERLRMEAQNRDLKQLVRRQERFARRLERFLAASQAERQALEAELARILGSPPSGTGAGRY